MSELKQSSVTLLEDAIDRKIRNAQKGRDTTLATVTRVDSDGTTWVRVYGGADETPVRRMTSSAQVGDVINVVFSGLSCMGVGNVTNPSASVVQVESVEIAARGAAVAAKEAWAHADDAAVAAKTAWNHAEDAADAAQNAWNHADEAADAAESASWSATNALTQLSFVEDVAGTLQWIQDHGTFAATSDTSLQEGKVYFTYNSTTQDYEPITSPAEDADPHALGWYELDITDSQTDFIMAHLAVTSRGLWVLPSGIGSAADEQHAAGYKMLLSNDGAYVYDGSGALVITYGANITPSTNRPFYIGDPNSTSYILFTPESGSTPASIRIGGSVSIGGSKTLGELLTDTEAAVRTALDGAVLTISSTNGQLFKNGSESTILQVAVFPNGGERCDTIAQVRSRFGNSAYIEWQWKHDNGDWGVMLNSDTHISQGGMWLTVTPDDVATKTSFSASLIVP